MQARDVAAVLPQALQLRALDAELARALAPPVEDAITASIQRNPKPLADALFPVMGPAIRKAVAASLAGMVESFNRTLEHSLSWRSLTWRVEALRTGRSFGEVVLLHTLLFRVEQVFLIDRTSGLLLQHVQAGVAGVQDADMVSGMLTAIRDFVGDSFTVADKSSLDAFQVGDLTVWIEQGPRAIIAAVIRGTPPQALRASLQEALETIHLQLADAFDAFQGDASPFEAARPELDACLRAEYRRDDEAAPAGAGAGRGAGPRRAGRVGRPGLARAAALERLSRGAQGRARHRGRLGGAHRRQVRRQRAPRRARRQSRRPAAADLARSRRRSKDAGGPTRRSNPRSCSPTRARRCSRRPRPRWISPTACSECRAAPRPRGCSRPASGRRSLPASFASMRARPSTARSGTWSGASRRRSRCSSGAPAGWRLDRRPRSLTLVADVGQLDALLAAADRRARIAIVGHTDSDGAPLANVPLSLARAERVHAALVAGPFTRLTWSVNGAGSSEPVVAATSEPAKQQNRRVEPPGRGRVTAAEGRQR